MADLKEGDLVYYWDGERPEKPHIGYFVERLKDGRFSVEASSKMGLFIWDHVEPLHKPECWADDEGNEIKEGDLVEAWDNEFSDRVTAALFRKDKYGYATKDDDDDVPLYWKHAKKVQPIRKGTLVAAWDDDEEPKRPKIAYYEGAAKDGAYLVRYIPAYLHVRQHVRPVTPEDLEKWRGEDD